MEPVVTATFFANCKALGGDTCAQIVYGIQSRMINVYPMKAESHSPVTYEDFLREELCPTSLRQNDSQIQNSDDFTAICRQFCLNSFSAVYRKVLLAMFQNNIFT